LSTRRSQAFPVRKSVQRGVPERENSKKWGEFSRGRGVKFKEEARPARRGFVVFQGRSRTRRTRRRRRGADGGLQVIYGQNHRDYRTPNKKQNPQAQKRRKASRKKKRDVSRGGEQRTRKDQKVRGPLLNRQISKASISVCHFRQKISTRIMAARKKGRHLASGRQRGKGGDCVEGLKPRGGWPKPQKRSLSSVGN